MDEGLALVEEMSPRRKAAILCVTLGPDGAAEVFKHLPSDVMEKLTVEMARTSDVRPEHADAVRREAIETAYARGYVAEGGIKYAREVLMRAVGQHRADEILSRLQTVIEATPFDFLNAISPDQIFTFLRSEHPQTTALVIANLPSTDLAAKVMRMIPHDQQADVALRIATMNQTAPDVVRDVAEVMARKFENVLGQDYAAAGGVQSLAEILNSSDRTIERNVLEYLESAAPELADEVRSLLFVFEDLLKLDDRTIQLVLKEVDAKDLALALRGASNDVKERILANMSQRGAEMLREEMEFMPAQRRRVVEEAQSKIVAVVRRLEDSGAIVLSRGGETDEDELIG